MPEIFPPPEILGVMIDMAHHQPDVPVETICAGLAVLLADPDFAEFDEDLYAEFVRLGAVLWRHAGEFRGAGEGQTRQ